MPKVIAGVIVILIVAYIIANPTQSAHMVQGGWGHTKDFGHALGSFVNHLSD